MAKMCFLDFSILFCPIFKLVIRISENGTLSSSIQNKLEEEEQEVREIWLGRPCFIGFLLTHRWFRSKQPSNQASQELATRSNNQQQHRDFHNTLSYIMELKTDSKCNATGQRLCHTKHFQR